MKHLKQVAEKNVKHVLFDRRLKDAGIIVC